MGREAARGVWANDGVVRADRRGGVRDAGIYLVAVLLMIGGGGDTGASGKR